MKKLGWTAVPQPTVPQHIIEETAFELSDQLSKSGDVQSQSKSVGDHHITVHSSGGTHVVVVWKQIKYGQIDEVDSRQEEI